MENKTRYETQRLDYLGIVAGISQEIGLVKLIDEKVGNVQRKVSCGQAVQAIVLNTLCDVGPLLIIRPALVCTK